MNVRLRKSIKCADMQSSLICVVAGVPADEKFDRPDSGWVSDWLNIIRIFWSSWAFSFEKGEMLYTRKVSWPPDVTGRWHVAEKYSADKCVCPQRAVCRSMRQPVTSRAFPATGTPEVCGERDWKKHSIPAVASMAESTGKQRNENGTRSTIGAFFQTGKENILSVLGWCNLE